MIGVPAVSLELSVVPALQLTRSAESLKNLAGFRILPLKPSRRFGIPKVAPYRSMNSDRRLSHPAAFSASSSVRPRFRASPVMIWP